MKKTILLAAFVSLFAHSNAQTTFLRTLGTPGDDYACSVHQTSDGGYIIAGQYDFPVEGGLFLARIDANGDTAWTRSYGSIFSPYSYSVMQTADSGFVVGCTVANIGAGQYDACLVKTDASGQLTWLKTYGGALDQWAFSAQQTTDGGYVLCGLSYTSGYADIYLVRANADGSMRWRRNIGGADEDIAYSVQQTSDGGFIMTGQTLGVPNGAVYLVKTDSAGSTTWTQTIGGNVGYAYCVRELSGGGYVMTGTGSGGIYLGRTDPLGNPLWHQHYVETSGTNSIGRSVRETSDGGFIVAGEANRLYVGDTAAAILLKTDGQGNLQWSKLYGGPGQEIAYDVVQATGGGYLVAATTSSFGTGGIDMYLIKTDSLGNSSGCNQLNGSIQASVPFVITGTLAPFTFTDGVMNSPSVTTKSGCAVVPLCPTGAEEQEGAPGFSAPYPNPAQESVMLHYELPPGAGSAGLIIYDMSGREVMREEVPGGTSAALISVKELAPGVYCYALSAGGMLVRGKKFAVK